MKDKAEKSVLHSCSIELTKFEKKRTENLFHEPLVELQLIHGAPTGLGLAQSVPLPPIIEVVALPGTLQV